MEHETRHGGGADASEETDADRAVLLLAPRLGGPVDIAIVLGTGLGGVTEGIEGKVAVPYAEIPGFPHAGVSGHAGQLTVGLLEGRRIAVMQGRAHYYERGDASVMRSPIETLKRLGVSTLILTNASGSLRKDLPPGCLVAVSDHINLSGANPLIGDSGDGRFVSLTDAYAPHLRQRFMRAATASGSPLQEGVYVWASGPSFETPAEIRMMRAMGGDLVGMSTVPEVILARRFGIDVAAISIVTNYAAGIDNASPSHAETKQVAGTAAIALRRLLMAFLKGLDDD